MRVLESHTLTVLATDTCTAKCAHCSMNSSPTRRGKLDAEQICDYINQAAEGTRVKTVVFAGGEPLLLGEDLYTSLRHIRSLGLSSRIVTNAYWANSVKRAEEITGRLREAGLNEVNISIDDFHLPYINPQNVKRAFDAAVKLDFGAVIIAHCKGPNTKFNDEELDELLGVSLPRIYNEKGERDFKSERLPRDGRPYVAVANNTLQFIGRGVVELRPEDVKFDESWNSRSRELGGCPYAVRSAAVSPAGRLLTCCGFEVAGNEILDLGDLHERSMGELLDKADNDLLLNLIALDGPYKIMDFLKECAPDLPFRKRYSSFCELCQHIVTEPVIRQSLYDNMHRKAPEIAARRVALAEKAAEDAEFDALYHASDPAPPS